MHVLQRKLDMVASPSDSKHGSSPSASSIPPAHKEYEKYLRQLESECRAHIKCEQQMKLHLESMTEKVDQLTSEQEKIAKERQEQELKIKTLHGTIAQVETRLKSKE